MDESYGTYVDDEYFDNHDYDDTDDDSDDDNDHKKDSYTAAGAAPTQTCSWARQGFLYTRARHYFFNCWRVFIFFNCFHTLKTLPARRRSRPSSR